MQELIQEYRKVLDTKIEKVNELNELCDKLITLEIKEANERVNIMNRLEAKAIADGKKVTDKTKVATADAELENEINQIKHLKNDINKVKRDIELCDDEISLFKYTIRVLEQ